MAVQRQLVQLPFTGGVDQRVADEYLDPTTHILDAQNIVWTKEGGADKRMGVLGLSMTQLSSDPTMGAPRRLLTRRNEVLLTDGDALYTNAPNVTSAEWYQRGLMPACVGTRDHLYSAPAQIMGLNVAEGAGVRAVIGRTAGAGGPSQGDVVLSTYDLTTGATLLSNVQLTTGGTFNCAQVHIVTVTGVSYIVVLYSGPSSTTIFGQIVSVASMTVTTTQTAIVTDSNGQFDSVLEVGGPGIAIVYVQLSAGPDYAPRVIRLEALPAFTIGFSFLLNGATATPIDLVAARVDYNVGVSWFAWE
ncbi:MAG TPA: hypothetical protein VF219_19515, partial [Vicinamibacterales bacterium]